MLRSVSSSSLRPTMRPSASTRTVPAWRRLSKVSGERRVRGVIERPPDRRWRRQAVAAQPLERRRRLGRPRPGDRDLIAARGRHAEQPVRLGEACDDAQLLGLGEVLHHDIADAGQPIARDRKVEDRGRRVPGVLSVRVGGETVALFCQREPQGLGGAQRLQMPSHRGQSGPGQDRRIERAVAHRMQQPRRRAGGLHQPLEDQPALAQRQEQHRLAAHGCGSAG